MRKIIKTLLVVLVLCLVITAFASCYKPATTKPTEKPEPEHTHAFGEAGCRQPATCECGETQGEALGHDFVDGVCTRCDEFDPEYVVPHEHRFVDGVCSCGEEDPNYVPPHVNALVVGETNKIVVTGETLNDYGFPIEWVVFVADEKANYAFVGDNNALVYIFDSNLNLLCGGTGAADLEAGTYLICLGNGVVGEFNVVVTKTAIATHEHVWSDATCTESQKCECGETQGEALGHELVDVEAKEKTCTEDGHNAHKACTRCDYTEGKEVVAAGHALKYTVVAPTVDAAGYTTLVCEACDAFETVVYDSVNVMTSGEYVLDASDDGLVGTEAKTYADGQVYVHNNVWEMHLSAKFKVDGSNKTFPDDTFLGTRLNFGGKTQFKESGAIVNGIVFTTTGETTVKVYWVEGGDDHRQVALYNLEGEIVVQSDNQTAVKNDPCVDTFTVSAGTYVLGNVVNTNYIFRVEVVVSSSHTHELVDVEGKDATCTEDGYTAYKACECGYTEGKEVIAATGHSYEAVVTAPTCTVDGYTTHTCSCGDSYVDGEVAAPGHDYDVIVTAPTCTEAGYTEHICGICDDTYTDSEVAALGHDLVDVEGKEATCSVAGYTAHKDCSRCNYVEGKEVVAATGAHVDATEDYKCDVCSTKMLPADGTTLTIEQALTIAKLAGSSYTTQKYYITGIVTNVYNTTYGNLYLKDGNGNQICIYGLYTWDKAVRYDKMEYKPVEGDELTVYTVLGAYGTTYQGKDAWVDDVVAHEHNYVAVVTEPGCLTTGYTTHTCSICSASHVDTEVAALGHTTDNGECERCGLTIGGDAPVVGTLAEFTFGANGTASHVDGNDLGTSKSWTVGSYTLSLTGMSKVFGTAYDAKGNSCIKLGTSKVVGTFTFTVPENVTEVVIYVAGYKAATSTNIKINGTSYTVKDASNNGAYTAITIDTTTTKTITFTSVTYRCMIDSIVFNGTAQ